MVSVLERFKSAYNSFVSPPTVVPEMNYGDSYYTNGRRISSTFTSEGSLISKIYNQISVDVSQVSIRHIRLGQNGRYEDDIKSSLNNCLTLRPNIDQTSQRFFQDLVWTMFDNGAAVVVPVDTTDSIYVSSGFDIKSMRVGKVKQWFPRHIRVELYNDRTGRTEELTLPKENVAVVTNPLYDVMNKPNSDLRRLVEKIRILDAIDVQSSAGRLDMIIKLPYEIRNDLKASQADSRRKDIEKQLNESKYGIAYVGATEQVTQLNRPMTNNLMDQITYLTGEVYNALGLTKEVFDGTASDGAMLNYYVKTVNPILDEITAAFSWGLLSQTARTQGQAVRWFRDPFQLVPMSQFAEIATALTTAEIGTSNEMRSQLGWKPSMEPEADQLRNSNINPLDGSAPADDVAEDPTYSDTGDGSAGRSLGDMTWNELLGGQNGT